MVEGHEHQHCPYALGLWASGPLGHGDHDISIYPVYPSWRCLAASFVFPGRNHGVRGTMEIVKARRIRARCGVASWLQQQFHGSANNLSKKVIHLRRGAC